MVETRENSGQATSSDEKGNIALAITNLSKTYPAPLARLKTLFRLRVKPPVRALHDVSLRVYEGEVFGLIGRNGAGKTTLAKIIATLVQPTNGVVTVRGYDSVLDEERVRAQVGLATAEERSFYWRLTVEQNLLFFARLYGITEARSRQRIKELLALLELEPLRRRRFGELSTGNKQRMALARALLPNPPVLLLDEPTRSLDPVAASKMRALILSLARESETPVTVFLTSHNLAEVEELCARVAVISRGRIRALDTPQSLRAMRGQRERVQLSVKHLTRARAEAALSHRLGDVEINEELLDQTLGISFTREAGDGTLDEALRLILEGGSAVLSCEAERGTLLDVLEAYECDGDEGSAA